ncbi:CLUMA_CG014726, isoform A [Clunio marinus]|uniref:CLUMA_CG014726, isoform A n=1 Tax=Clunio marinus TaxID=568069 RepID=A0A1J1ISI6_9DIPT|nr:CLUMA_CG014726, isoform A [Clunio marinus]
MQTVRHKAYASYEKKDLKLERRLTQVVKHKILSLLRIFLCSVLVAALSVWKKIKTSKLNKLKDISHRHRKHTKIAILMLHLLGKSVIKPFLNETNENLFEAFISFIMCDDE